MRKVFIAPIVTILAFGLNLFGSDFDAMTRPALNPDALHDDLEGSFDAGGVVFLATVADWKVMETTGPVQRGIVTLRTAKVFLGEVGNKETLPFAWISGANLGDFVEVWPRLDRIAPGTLFAFVVLPHASDNEIGDVGATDGAATIVHALTGPGDPYVKSLHACIGLWRAGSGDSIWAKLKDAACSEDPVIRRFVVSMAARKMAKIDAGKALDVLTVQADARAKLKLANVELKRLGGSIADISRSEALPSESVKKAIQVLTALLFEAPPEDRVNSIQYLGNFLSDLHTPVAAADVLAPNDIRRLSEISVGLTHSEDGSTSRSATTVRSWVGVTQTK